MRIIGNDPSTPRQTKIVASGTLSTGDTVVVNADGTVSAAGINTVSTSVGADSVFEAASSTHTATVYDPVEDKVVVFYSDGGNSSKGTYAVGTVSGSSISFSTPQLFTSSSVTNMSATYDAASGNMVVAYEDVSNSEYGTGIVGSLSGTTMTFGTAVVFSSSRLGEVNIGFDSTANKVVIAYADLGDSGYGKAIVGTVSGTSISFGSSATFNGVAGGTGIGSVAHHSASGGNVISYQVNNSPFNPQGKAILATVSGTSISFGSAATFKTASVAGRYGAYDPNSEKVVISFRDSGDSNKGKAVVATVTGTSISFGTEVTYSVLATNYSRIVFDANVGRMIISYMEQDASNSIAIIVGTVSGTSISFDTRVIVGGAPHYISSAYDSGSKKVIISYQDQSNSSFGTSNVITSGGDVSNITSENYIGTVASGVSSGNGAKINLKGAVDENQSGLTAGQSYYVQTDGTLGTTPADPSVFAGTAVAANKLIVKG